MKLALKSFAVVVVQLLPFVLILSHSYDVSDWEFWMFIVCLLWAVFLEAWEPRKRGRTDG